MLGNVDTAFLKRNIFIVKRRFIENFSQHEKQKKKRTNVTKRFHTGSKFFA